MSVVTTPVPSLPADFVPQLVALDVDDTLLAHNGAVNERVIAAIERVRAAGIAVVLATGRSPSTTLPIARAAGLDDVVICSNGALLVDIQTEDTIEAKTFDPRPVLEELIEHLPQAVFAVEDVHGVFHATAAFSAGVLGMSVREVPFEHLLAEPVVRLVVRSEHHIESGLGEVAERLGYDSVVFGVADVAWLDVGADGVNKATMLQRLCELRELDPALTLAIGDFWNDVEMLQWAGWGVAMGSAPAEIKALAKSVTSDVPGDGVADVLDSIQL